jgi:hypothetical protein
MNGICSIHNPSDTCQNNSIKLGSRFKILVDKNVNRKVGERVADFIDTGFEWRNFSFCEHPVSLAMDKIPKNSYFPVIDGNCPNDSTELGQIALLDTVGDEQPGKIGIVPTAPVTGAGGDFLQYRYLLPKLCRSDKELEITPNIMLPAKHCTAKNWTQKGTFGVLRPVTETGLFSNKFEFDQKIQIEPSDYIMQPKLCVGEGNKTVVLCTNKEKYGLTKFRDSQLCDNAMRTICKNTNFISDPVCSCINSKAQVLSNPTCIDKLCQDEGYQPDGLIKTPCEISNVVVDCESYNRIKKNNPSLDILNNPWTEFCFEESTEPPPQSSTETIIERSSGSNWFTDTRIYVFTIVLIVFLSLVLYYNL